MQGTSVIVTKLQFDGSVDSKRTDSLSVLCNGHACREPAHLDRPHLHRFKTLAGWKHESTDHIPVVYPITCQFKMALALMTSKRFPFSVLGTVVNRRCRYELKRRIDFQEKLIHRQAL